MSPEQIATKRWLIPTAFFTISWDPSSICSSWHLQKAARLINRDVVKLNMFCMPTYFGSIFSSWKCGWAISSCVSVLDFFPCLPQTHRLSLGRLVRSRTVTNTDQPGDITGPRVWHTISQTGKSEGVAFQVDGSYVRSAGCLWLHCSWRR